MENYVVEVCPYCDREIEIRWDTKEFGYKVFCPHCGNAMMLCDECMHPDGEFDDRCNWNRITGRCKHNTLPEPTELDRLTRRIEPNVGNGIGIERVCHYGKDRSEVGCYGCVERTKCNHDLFQRLALYEDTGLSPERVEALIRILKGREAKKTNKVKEG